MCNDTVPCCCRCTNVIDLSCLHVTFAVEEEQAVNEEEADVDADEEPEDEQHSAAGDDGYTSDDNPIDEINEAHAVTTPLEKVTELTNPAMEDVLTEFCHLHLPGFQEVIKGGLEHHDCKV